MLVAPLMPGINDAPEQVEEILQLAAEAGAVHIGGIALHLRGEVRGIFMEWLRSYRPDLVPRYEELYRRGAYMPRAERARLSGMVNGGPIDPSRYIQQRERMRAASEPREEAVPAPKQPSLF